MTARARNDPGNPSCPPETALELLAERTHADPRTLATVAQTLSHELRTPLTTIYTGSKLLTNGSRLSDALVREIASAIEVDAERLLRIIEDLVVAAALPGQPAITGEPVLLQRLLPSVARTAASRWPAATVVVALPDHLPAVRADEAHLGHVLRNLLDNAAQYGPDDGQIVVRAAVRQEHMEIHVIDEGPGIAPHEAERMFRLFEGPGTPDRPGGIGLGLFVCRRLMTLMGGDVRIATHDGAGTQMTLDLPRYPADER